MTAINIVLTDHAAHLFCDTKAGYEGLQLARVVKCLPIPHLNAAIAVRGEARALAAVHMVASNVESIEELRRELPVALKGAEHQGDSFTRLAAGELDAFLIAFDKAPVAFAVFTHGKHGYAPFSIVDIPGGCFTPTVAPVRMQRLIAEHQGPALGLAALHVQAQTDQLTVGGFVQETIVDVEGIHIRNLGELRPAFDPLSRPAMAPATLPAAFARHLQTR